MFGLLLTAGLPGDYDYSNLTKEELLAEISQLQGEIAADQAGADTASADIAALGNEIAAYQATIGSIDGSLSGYDQERGYINQHIAEIESNISSLESQINDTSSYLGDLLQQAEACEARMSDAWNNLNSLYSEQSDLEYWAANWMFTYYFYMNIVGDYSNYYYEIYSNWELMYLEQEAQDNYYYYSGLLQTVEQNIAYYESEQTNAGSEWTSLSAQISALEAALAGLEQMASYEEDDLLYYANQLEWVDAQIQDLNGQMAFYESLLAQSNADYSELDSALTSRTAALATQQALLESLLELYDLMEE